MQRPQGQLLHRSEIDTARGTENHGCVQSISQLFHELLLFLHRILAVFARTINGQRLFQRSKDIGIVHYHAAMFAGKHPVRPCNGLHERVISHGLVHIHGRTARRVEASQPHGADKHQPQRIVGVLELLIECLVVHPLPVRFDFQAKLPHLLDFVLSGRDNERHVGGLEYGQPAIQLLRLGQHLWCPVFYRVEPYRLLFCSRQFNRPMLSYLVVHLESGGFVDGYHHCLTDEAAPKKMPHDVLRHRFQPVIPRENVVLPAQLLFKPRFLLGVQLGRLDEFIDVLVQVWVN